MDRRTEAYEIRVEAAQLEYSRPHPNHPTNGEESTYRNANNKLSYIANYTKGLPHNNNGEVNRAAYRTLLKALRSGDPHDFEQIKLAPLPAGKRHRRLINPQAGLAFDLEGPDSHALRIPPPARIDQARTSADMGELYWMAVARDVNFDQYGTGTGTDAGGITATAAASLSPTSAGGEFSDFHGPKGPAGNVTPNTLFRGPTPGDLVGPYLSQFLIKDVPYGAYRLAQRQETANPGTDFMQTWADWLLIQNGAEPDIPLPTTGPNNTFYIRNLRDLAYHVRIDVSYQHYLDACLILQQMDLPPTTLAKKDAPPCMSGPIDVGNPYYPPGPFPPAPPRSEEGFATFGNWHIQPLLAEVTTRALKAAWFQKWFVHRRLRPEELGGLIEGRLSKGRNYPVNAEILDSLQTGKLSAAPADFPRGPAGGTFLLPQAFPEGSPLHPSDPEGHATVAGACVTVLKAWFDESYQFDPNSPNPFERPEVSDPTPPNQYQKLKPYTPPTGQPPLTVGGELNKLASNIGLGGRGGAGVHYRTDHESSLRLGEEVAIGILEEQKRTYNEYNSFTLTKFDGTAITI